MESDAPCVAGGFRSGTDTFTNASMQAEVKSRSFFHFQACQWVTEQGIKNSGVIREQASNVKAVGC